MKSGTTMKMNASTTALAVSERYHRGRGARAGAGAAATTSCRLWAGNPAVTEAGIVVDLIEFRVEIAELLADALDEGTDIGAIAFVAIAGHEVLAMHQVVDLTIADIFAGALREQRYDLELGQGQVEDLAVPGGAVDVEAQLEPAEAGDVARLLARIGLGNRAHALGDEMQSLHEDRQPPRLVDEVDGATFECRLFIDVVAEYGEEDDGRRRAGAAQAAQHFEPVHPGHAPVEQDDVGLAALREIVERRHAVVEADDGKTLVDQIETERLAERVVVVNEDDPYRRQARRRRAVRGRARRSIAVQGARVIHGSSLRNGGRASPGSADRNRNRPRARTLVRHSARWSPAGRRRALPARPAPPSAAARRARSTGRSRSKAPAPAPRAPGRRPGSRASPACAAVAGGTRMPLPQAAGQECHPSERESCCIRPV